MDKLSLQNPLRNKRGHKGKEKGKSESEHRASPEILIYLKHELMHVIWKLILNDKLMEAYEHGIVIKCSNDIWQRFYPQFFTYSADYPEKCVLNNLYYLFSLSLP